MPRGWVSSLLLVLTSRCCRLLLCRCVAASGRGLHVVDVLSATGCDVDDVVCFGGVANASCVSEFDPRLRAR